MNSRSLLIAITALIFSFLLDHRETNSTSSKEQISELSEGNIAEMKPSDVVDDIDGDETESDRLIAEENSVSIV